MTLDDIKARCEEVGDCWIWQGGCDGHGRPVLSQNRRSVYARRYVRELVDGAPVPAGKVAASRCGDRKCISPHCSVVATTREKARMASARGAYLNPSRDAKVVLKRRAASRFSEEVIERVRQADGPAYRIAAEVDMSVSHVKAIRRGDARKPLSSPFAGLGAR